MHIQSLSTQLDARLSTTPILAWTAGIELDVPLKQTLDVDTYGLYDTFINHPQRFPALTSAVGVEIHPMHRLLIGVAFRREQWHFGSSSPTIVTRDGIVSGVAAYPGSHQSTAGLGLKIAVTL